MIVTISVFFKMSKLMNVLDCLTFYALFSGLLYPTWLGMPMRLVYEHVLVTKSADDVFHHYWFNHCNIVTHKELEN